MKNKLNTPDSDGVQYVRTRRWMGALVNLLPGLSPIIRCFCVLPPPPPPGRTVLVLPTS